MFERKVAGTTTVRLNSRLINHLDRNTMSGILQSIKCCASNYNPRLISHEARNDMNHASNNIATTDQQQLTVCKAKLSDVAPIFNLIQECSESGHLNNIYLTPPYQTGVALQLFSVWLFKKIRLPSGAKYKSTLHVIRHKGIFAGFILMRYLEPSGASQEIYMCAIKSQYRRKGLGRRLIQSVLNNLKSNTIVEAECLSKAMDMKRLLRSMGFESVNHNKATISNKIPERFRISCALKQE